MIELNSEIILLKAEETRQANLMNAHEIRHWKNENFIIQLTATINDMKTKFERGLKSGDEKFSATADIVFKTSDSQQFLTQPSSEPLIN